VVDVDAFAVQNSFEVNYELPKNETIVLVNAGASVCNINVLANGLTTFTRDVTMGGNQFTEESRSSSTSATTKAEKLKWEATPRRTPTRGPAGSGARHPGRGRPDGRRDPALLDFYTATAADSHIGGSISPAHRQDPRPLQGDRAAVGVPVEILNPFKGGDRQPPLRPQHRDGRRSFGGRRHRLALRKSNER